MIARAMVESEEVSLQTTAEAGEGFCCSKRDREIIPQFGGQDKVESGREVLNEPVPYRSFSDC